VKMMRMAMTAHRVINQILGLKPGEKVLIITDTDRPRTITEALSYSATAAGAEVVVVIMHPQEVGGQEPPGAVAAAMQVVDAVINQATQSMTHTEATRAAIKKGVRVANLRNMDEDMWVRGGVTADYNYVKALSEKLAGFLTAVKEIRLTTPNGTDLTMRADGRRGFAQTGFARKPGQFSGLPDGEATLAPIEGSTNGVIVDPYIADQLGLITDPFRVEITNGRISKIEGGAQAERLKELLTRHDENADTLASQFALGTNPACRVMANTREVSKKWGTAHVAQGDNATLEGKIESSMHIDYVFLNPTVYFDGQVVLDGGQLLVDVEGKEAMEQPS